MTEIENFVIREDENNIQPLANYIHRAVEHYFAKLEGETPFELYKLVLTEMEPPLFKNVMKFVRGNQSKAAKLLGLSRGTLRKKLKQFGMLKEGKQKK